MFNMKIDILSKLTYLPPPLIARQIQRMERRSFADLYQTEIVLYMKPLLSHSCNVYYFAYFFFGATGITKI